MGSDAAVSLDNSALEAQSEAMPSRRSDNDVPLLEVQDLDCTYRSSGPLSRLFGQPPAPVVQGLSFSIADQETFALVGESGSGKTTIARAIAGLLVPTQGRIVFEGTDITAKVESRPQELHRGIQFVFQNPDSSLNPHHRVSRIVGRSLELFAGSSERTSEGRVESLLQDVGLDASYKDRYPKELSGGERQRIAIARALAADPKLILCDEIVSALDVSVQARTLDLLQELQEEREVAYLFIAHDLAVVRWLAHRVGVLYLGRLVEVGTAEEVFLPPSHPYTDTLLQSVPEPDPGQPFHPRVPSKLMGDERDASGCPFFSRCDAGVAGECDCTFPRWQAITPTHRIRCRELQQTA